MDSSSISSTTTLLPNPTHHHHHHPPPLSTPWLKPKPRSLPTRTRSISISHNPKKPSLSTKSALAQETPTPLTPTPSEKLRRLASEFRSLPERLDRVKRLLAYAAQLPPLPEEERTPGNRVMGCTAQVWVTAAMDGDGRVRFGADSDSEITKGFCACLVGALDGAVPEEVMGVAMDDLEELNVVGVGGRVSSRVNTWYNVLVSMQKRTKALVAEREGRVPVEPFPSLAVGVDGVRAMGSYAEAQVMINRTLLTPK